MQEWDVREKLRDIKVDLVRIENLLNKFYASVIGEKLQLVFQGEAMPKFKMGPTSKGFKATMPGAKWSTLAAGITFQLVDANGTPLGAIDPTTVTTTLVANDTATPPGVSTLATFIPGADSLHYKISRTQATGNIILNATLAENSGSPGPFSASLPIELDALAPGAPTDLTLIISGN